MKYNTVWFDINWFQVAVNWKVRGPHNYTVYTNAKCMPIIVIL